MRTDDSIFKYYYYPLKNRLEADKRSVPIFKIGDSVIVTDGSYNSDLDGFMKDGVKRRFSEYHGEVINSELTDRWIKFELGNVWIIVRLDLHLKFNDPDKTEIYCSSLCVKSL